jgi:hypothetical protein
MMASTTGGAPTMRELLGGAREADKGTHGFRKP